MLPGQIENWVFIIDLNKTGLTDLPLSVIFSHEFLYKNWKNWWNL